MIEVSIVLKPKHQSKLKEETIDKSFRYLVALSTGGLMGGQNISYKNYKIIEARTSEEATTIYNKENECSYFGGSCIGIISETNEEILISNCLTEALLVDIEMDEDDIYLIAEIDGGYQECSDFIYSNFNILKVEKNQQVNFDDRLNNSCYVVGKYNRQKNTFEIPIHHKAMISSLVNEIGSKKVNNKRLIRG